MGLLVALTYVVVWLIPTHTDLVYTSLLDKHALLRAQPSPRLIFIGGSGIALGLDSGLIEEQLGLPVINMGINAGFGLHYMLEEVRPLLHPGDLVVIVPEYEHFYGTLAEGDQNLLWALRIRPESIQQMTWPQLRQLLPNIPGFMQQRVQEILRRWPDPIYNRAAFNEHGDFVNHLTLPAQSIKPYAINDRAPFNPMALAELIDFVVDAKAHGTLVILMYPAIADTFWRYQQNAQVIQDLQQRIQESGAIQEGSTPSDYVLPEALFFDTVYHLSKVGRQVRSERMAQALQRYSPSLARSSHNPSGEPLSQTATGK
jgi:hypothetical protein